MPGNAPPVWSLPLNTASGRMGVGMEVPELMTAQQVARLLGISTETLRKWRAKRKCLPYVRVGSTSATGPPTWPRSSNRGRSCPPSPRLPFPRRRWRRPAGRARHACRFRLWWTRGCDP
ncbi:helix-turn-helix domain-containing protein [Bifidobacterium thermophilum]|uniref:Helix-turn-helix domain-containing protein n=1 Tax=Bifidobacterium thermophilum TaxID=33905 RepID=A0A7X9RPC4_9BIFI|nr:helix-turn-helix domain-containing protein [Bifidobacterium thermophilum]